MSSTSVLHLGSWTVAARRSAAPPPDSWSPRAGASGRPRKAAQPANAKATRLGNDLSDPLDGVGAPVIAAVADVRDPVDVALPPPGAVVDVGRDVALTGHHRQHLGGEAADR